MNVHRSLKVLLTLIIILGVFFHVPHGVQVWDIDDANEGHYVLRTGDDPLKYTEEIYTSITQGIDKLVETLAQA